MKPTPLSITTLSLADAARMIVAELSDTFATTARPQLCQDNGDPVTYEDFIRQSQDTDFARSGGFTVVLCNAMAGESVLARVHPAKSEYFSGHAVGVTFMTTEGKTLSRPATLSATASTPSTLARFLEICHRRLQADIAL